MFHIVSLPLQIGQFHSGRSGLRRFMKYSLPCHTDVRKCERVAKDKPVAFYVNPVASASQSLGGFPTRESPGLCHDPVTRPKWPGLQRAGLHFHGRLFILGIHYVGQSHRSIYHIKVDPPVLRLSESNGEDPEHVTTYLGNTPCLFEL